MWIILESGGEKVLPFGSALAGTIAKSIEISWAEFDQYILREGEKRFVSYINGVIRCRILDEGDLRILRIQ